MPDGKTTPPLWKPWRDGWVENTTKVCGVVLIFLFVSGLLGAGYDPIATNPYAWGVYARAVFLNLTGEHQ